MQFKVPQNIDMEDKIIGPLTLLQFIYLVIGGVFLYSTIKAGNTAMIIFAGIPVALLALALCFVKIQDQPFSKFVVSLIFYITRPKTRIWNKSTTLEELPTTQATQPTQALKTPAHKKVEKSELEKLSQVIDTRGWAGISNDHIKPTKGVKVNIEQK
ncbi:MAG: PrgI family protein [Patescibacteria group bacterium]|nr:PrgI family protein [Patescibacteria group bacterium]